MYDKRITKMTSYLTPRSSRFPEQDWVMMFGLQMFIIKYLRDDINKNFFNKSWKNIEKQYKTILTKSLGYTKNEYQLTLNKVKELHDFGYLPIKIMGLPEGSKVPMGVPCIEISVTNKRFPWVGQAIECMLSCNIWHPMISATVAYKYRELASAYAKKSSDKADGTLCMCDFSLRGQESMESAIASSVGWLTSMRNSSTVPARAMIEHCYPLTNKRKLQIGCLTSTEHSVMTTDFAINKDERETYRRLLSEVYPNTSFAAVSDSYDFWNVLTNILPTLKDEINNHKGFIGVRHDSAEPVEALCGIPQINIVNEIAHTDYNLTKLYEQEISKHKDFSEYANEKFGEEFKVYVVMKDSEKDKILAEDIVSGKYTTNHSGDIVYKVTKIEDRERTYEEKGMVETIYELLGGSVNSKGYNVCNPHIKAVYGDSITLERAKKIFERLDAKKFAIENISLGVGSFSMQALEYNDKLYPFTRDTFSIAIKCTWAELEDGTQISVYKSPKNFSGKKSQKGLCKVQWNEEKGKYEYTDGYTDPYDVVYDNAFVKYFENGSVIPDCCDFDKVRERINKYFE
jgi:nicotinamide phosphoribosyltransferase